jgi:hypothetical protein
LRDPRALFDVGVQAVVELADNEQLAVLPRDLIRLRFPLSDGGADPGWLIRIAGCAVAALIEARVATLVCCSCGLNRSLCVAAGALAVVERRPFDEMILAVAKSGPADVSPSLVAQFQAAFRQPTPADSSALDELLKRITPENIHGETDWGPPVGDEQW